MDQFKWGEIFENDVLRMVLPFCIIILVTRLIPVIYKNQRTKKYTHMTKLITYSIMAAYIFAYYLKSGERLINISIMNGFTLLFCILEIVDNIISLFEEPIIYNDIKKNVYIGVSNRARNFRYELMQISYYIKKGELKEDLKCKIISMNNNSFEVMNDFLWVDDNIMKIESNNDQLFETILCKIFNSKLLIIIKDDESEKVCIDEDCYDEFKALVNEFDNVFNHYEQIRNKLNKYANLLDMVK